MKKIYIAGKLNDSAVEYIKNMHRMMQWAERVRKLGFAVYIPSIDILMGMMFGDWEYEDYFDNSQPFLEACDAIFVCPDSEDSKGTQKEIKRAKEKGIPVFYSLEELNDQRNKNKKS